MKKDFKLFLLMIVVVVVVIVLIVVCVVVYYKNGYKIEKELDKVIMGNF